MASLKDVAKLAGVSLMTVSRAINNPEQLSEKTLTRVKQAIEQLGYVPNIAAQKIRGVSNNTIGVLSFSTATTPFSVEILLAIEQTVRKYGWNSFVINAFEDNPQDVEQAVDLLLSHRPTAIIITRHGLKEINVPKRLAAYPMVLANCVTRDIEVASYIPDDFQGQADVMSLLVEKGYKKPLCLYIPHNAIAAQKRQEGLHTVWFAQKKAHPLTEFFMDESDDYLHGADELKKLLEQGIEDFDYDVIVCGNDRIALLAYQMLLAKGLRIPQDVAVVGYDNMVGVAHLFLPPLTTVQLPHYEMGKQAALHLIEGRKGNNTYPIECPLIVRESC
ncbi:LacI family DNA-binding transcriptional regulator [Actinobacillus minor]|uniref:Periplasmic binding protein/LacI transcriptional regulator n=1 Tax=Actinobacillus minor NM305 TaxID=637911 RepID=C5S0I7_9PAST|nr:LacI family DNA-binding transcriptional regulator [Actinobacillus minor]EER47704.1 periplasmic binding protein/LacI transcriptional regulator [Actinobacillus minor NM305]MDD6911659.1 LacI family DNA-binding transcriptional regulator [Actinobacillus minor]MDY4714008.1 LacI family DNA-binding transcriptional regulator [Actinobacillus minor]